MSKELQGAARVSRLGSVSRPEPVCHTGESVGPSARLFSSIAAASPQKQAPNLADRRHFTTVAEEAAEPASDIAGTQFPLVTVVVPIRNEQAYIARCLNSILRSDYPADRFSVVVVDGDSDDGTREIIRQFAAEHDRVSVILNPQRSVPFALNYGLRGSDSDIVIRVDGHAEVAKDFVRKNVECLLSRPECWSCGGAIDTVGETRVGRVIAACMSHPAGVGNARFRLGGFDGYVDTVAFGAYWRWVFDRIGYFDEELVCNQDDEFNARIIRHDGRIYLSREIHSRYFPRASLIKLFRQYFRYGFWRIRTIQKHGRPATFRQTVPLIFVTALLSLMFASMFFSTAKILLAISLSMYAAVLMSGTISVMLKEGVLSGMLAPVVFAILHFSYGFGCLAGIAVRCFQSALKSNPVTPASSNLLGSVQNGMAHK